jgi:hypothetical protein
LELDAIGKFSYNLNGLSTKISKVMSHPTLVDGSLAEWSCASQQSHVYLSKIMYQIEDCRPGREEELAEGIRQENLRRRSRGLFGKLEPLEGDKMGEDGRRGPGSFAGLADSAACSSGEWAYSLHSLSNLMWDWISRASRAFVAAVAGSCDKLLGG